MAVDMEQVRAALEPEEPDYPGAATKLGPEALPHLERIIAGDHAGLAAKAAYLAGLIGTDRSVPVLEMAARSAVAAVRIAAAAAVPHLSSEHRESLLLQLVDDADAGVRKLAIRSAPTVMSDALRARVAVQSAAQAAPAAKAARAAKKPAAARPAAKTAATKARPKAARAAKRAAPRRKKG